MIMLMRFTLAFIIIIINREYDISPDLIKGLIIEL